MLKCVMCVYSALFPFPHRTHTHTYTHVTMEHFTSFCASHLAASELLRPNKSHIQCSLPFFLYLYLAMCTCMCVCLLACLLLLNPLASSHLGSLNLPPPRAWSFLSHLPFHFDLCPHRVECVRVRVRVLKSE